jgi:hypothetical protein
MTKGMTKKAKIITAGCVAALIMLAIFFIIKPDSNDAKLAAPKVEDTTTTVSEFPDVGRSVKDFVVDPYEIDMEAKGLLNDDELEDVALILQEKGDSTALRPTLVLLKQKDGSYKRYATSWNAIGPAYINGDYQHYDDENLVIDSLRNLNIHTYGSGPVGNRDLNYRFAGNQLVLATMETYNMGAGAHTEAYYDFIKGVLKITEINTMKEDMPSTTTEEKLKKRGPYLFETTDPESI